MAAVPELCDQLMEYSENDELFYTNDVPDKIKVNKCSHCYENRVTIKKLEIRKPEKSVHLFKKVKVLVTVVKKRGFNNQCFFKDDDLLTLVPVKENIAFRQEEIQEAPKTRFLYNLTTEHAIRDTKMRSLKLEGNNFIVVTFLEGENAQLEVKIIVNTYLEQNLENNKRPVSLGIVGQKLYLSCTAEGIADQVPTLTEVDNIKEKKTDSDLLPFIFYSRQDGSHCSFESAAFPGYYLSASQDEGEKLQLRQTSDVLVREFRLTPQLN
ncbi:interleukin-1 beta-like [Hyla sarda]|uniref:interleukin-1 beta-like n=1 Tax=Hyla sarda TaxID=327740 RepID=UPI0024C22005|nr:interleukin-1 beta-like [Hyla sarda]